MRFFVCFLRKNIAILIFLILWEVIPKLGLVDPSFVPPFSQVLATTWELIVSDNLIMHTLVSLGRALGGFIIAAIIAIPLGLLLGGWFPNLQLALEPLMDAFSQANPFILFHIILLFLGIGEATKIFIITWICIWPIMFSAISGIQNTDPVLLKSARSFNLGRWALFYKIVLPAAASSIFNGLRLSAGYSFFMLIAAEMMGASSGLGWLIISSQENFQMKWIFSAAMIITLLGLLIDSLMQFIEKRVIVWEETDAEELKN